YFSVVYQPQIHVADGRLRGFEALLRWQHPAVGEVPPALFIPLLEETRLINRLGSWIFDQGAEQRQAWSHIFAPDMVLSVCVSPTQFCLPNLASELKRAMDRFELKPGQIEVEITETALVNNLTHSHKQLKLLHEVGVRIALDDFGTGECSLSHLRNLQLDTLKLDRRFVANIAGSKREAAMASSIIDLSRNLDMLVIAEGVETAEQYQWLADNGCQVMQGFLIAHPMLPEDALRFPGHFDVAGFRQTRLL
ncbi:EAL domain-containing protein, partial [Pseudomonas syringae]|uniref:EAL domain-containing protein n=1 Tax=Pseudomonas syringae TaxID=317 RepID=UPI001F1CB73D